MEREEILRFAEECGITPAPSSLLVAKLIKFANAIAAHEREECAKIADRHGTDEENEYEQGRAEAALDISVAIRTRGNK